jgi:hypothetical protein
VAARHERLVDATIVVQPLAETLFCFDERLVVSGNARGLQAFRLDAD